MLLIGIGCSPVLMASYYIFAREFPPARFATLAALMLGVGSVGNLVASYPTALAVDLIGWRGSLAALSGLSIAVAAGILLTVRDPVTIHHVGIERIAGEFGEMRDILQRHLAGFCMQGFADFNLVERALKRVLRSFDLGRARLPLPGDCGNHIGAALHGGALHALNRARSAGFLAMQFNFVVATNTRAIDIWTRAGFDTVGRLPAAFRHPQQGLVDALVMYRQL